MNLSSIPNLKHTTSGNFFLIAGPCAVESKAIVFEIAEQVSAMCDELEIPYIFKASYDKANRTRLDSFRSIGKEKALDILREVKEKFQIPILTDIHRPEEAEWAAQVADVLQIPAFLCRQTDLLIAAGETGKTVNIKKGQFLATQGMKYAMEKVQSTGNQKIMLTERGTSFGYGDLIVDFRNIPKMKQLATTVLDCTHAIQQPNTERGVTGGQPQMIATLAQAGIATGVDGIFIETHPQPKSALSDGANMLPTCSLKPILSKLSSIKEII